MYCYSQQLVKKAPCLSGLRGRSAKPYFSGSNPLGASKQFLNRSMKLFGNPIKLEELQCDSPKLQRTLLTNGTKSLQQVLM